MSPLARAAALACVICTCALPLASFGQQAAPHEHRRGTPSTTITVAGDVLRPGPYDAAALRALPKVTQSMGGRTYTGVSLWVFLDTTAGLANTSGKPNEMLRKYVVATGTDGYQAVIALGEIAPGFDDAPDLIALDVDGAPLAADGFARLIVPRDLRPGRSVANLTRLEVLTVPSAAPTPLR